MNIRVMKNCPPSTNYCDKCYKEKKGRWVEFEGMEMFLCSKCLKEETTPKQGCECGDCKRGPLPNLPGW